MQIIVTMEHMLCAKSEHKWYFFRALMGGGEVPETTVVCKGSMGWQPREMETLSLTGEWVEYKGERQFQFRGAKLSLPLDPRSQLHYVCERSTGIGAALEQAIWDARRDDWRNLARGEVRKMSESAYNNFCDQIAGFDCDHEKAEIVAWLEDKGCTPNMAADAYEMWKSDATGIVTADCYRLAQLSGYSFKTVDENIRRNFDIAADDPRRIKSAVEYAMQQETEDGSTAVNCWKHFSACQKLLPNVGDELIVQYVREMKDDGRVRVFPSQNMMALKNDFLNETIIDEMVLTAVVTPATEIDLDVANLAAGEKFTPDETQVAAVKFAVENKFAVINGGAGVGKTTVIKMIVKGIETAFPTLAVNLCAPTGKAAARLKEASCIAATTIHVMLQAQGADRFAAGPLDACAVIVDEASMVDSALLAEIAKRTPAKLILVGDQAQLTPVGHGQPFHDIITIHPEVVRTLTKCYRNTEAVFQAATKIRDGNAPARSAESANERWIVAAASRPEDAQEMICAWARDGYLDFATDIVLCPKNGKRGENDTFQEATVNALNEELLAIDRAKRGQFGGEKYLPGDRVINTVNTPEAQVWNGTAGTVHAVNDRNEVFVHLDVPIRGTDGETKEIVLFTRDMVKNLRYAYALTVHKSQGSQYRKVVLAVLARDGFQLDRSLIYTGVTRTQSECVVVGDYNALLKGIARVRQKDTVLQCLNLERNEVMK